MIERINHLNRIKRLLRHHPIVILLGARQVGKTTLAKQIAGQWTGNCHIFDLERPRDLARLSDPELALEPLEGLVVLDEIQRLPDLFPLLRVLVDRQPLPARFLILGSAAPELLRQGNESLAGRVAFHKLEGFSLQEIGLSNHDQLWLRGGFPKSFLSPSDSESFNWREEFIFTFLEKDMPQLGIQVGAPALRRFWTMLAHYHGQIWNASEFARSFGVSHITIRRYLDILTSALVVRQLQPWHENIRKRQVKAPKVFFTDTGLLHALIGIENLADLECHPRLGASWEGFALTQAIEISGARPHECFFWATHTGAELDLLLIRGRKRWGFEFKRTSTPGIARSMKTALADLRLDHLFLVYPGESSFDLAEKVRAVAIGQLQQELPCWRG
ncbi:MAG: ATP-binding protein [Gammaproteobacteria bacterium]|nr:ATP-binding protein [Gammaproteobacteria bacterium]MCY4227720.1 ATP-binding protein [Gammaproteobacteria bacterium]